ncbi:hypothetical protein GCM10011587_19250 [Pyruvatibacter mobilis]|nr:hypothetical protein GCM10011587_19250 [Pyruvatibacter mobilis]
MNTWEPAALARLIRASPSRVPVSLAMGRSGPVPVDAAGHAQGAGRQAWEEVRAAAPSGAPAALPDFEIPF